MEIFQFAVIIGVFILISLVLGRYLYKIICYEKIKGDKFFSKIENGIYKTLKINTENMNWKQYGLAILITNITMIIFGIVFLMVKDGFTGHLSFNTAISFMTNTNLQDYAGENLSSISQMLIITFLMFTSAATGFAVCAAFVRLISGHKDGMGNFFKDMIISTVRVIVPLSFVVAIFLVSQGVPQTLDSRVTVNTLEGKTQTLAIGPVASLEAIKHIGTNGGGFFGANSAHPFENPTPLTNAVEMWAMMCISGAIIVAFGMAVKNRKQGRVLFVAVLALFLIALGVCYWSEKVGNPVLQTLGLSNGIGNMEGKEVRFGISGSAIFTTITTSFTTGTVNNMHDSLTPLGGLVPMWNMMLNVVFGGKGVGFMGIIMYAIITVFICGLMVGRTPEYLGKKIEVKDIKLLATALLVHPILILVASAISVISSAGLEGITNSGFHGLSQVLYQFASSAANNGSGFEGLADNTLFYNVAAGLVMFFGRYISMILILGAGASLWNKKKVPETVGTFRTDNGTFCVMVFFIILIVGALTFLPALVLGPVGEHLTLFNI